MSEFGTSGASGRVTATVRRVGRASDGDLLVGPGVLVVVERHHGTARCRAARRRRRRRAARRGCPARRSAPSSITRIRSASRIVESRWAITKLVRSRAQRGHRLLDQHLGAGVDRAGRLVEDQQRRVGEERPGDRDQLLLAGADVAALLVDARCRSRRAASARSGRRRSPGPPRGSAPRWRRGCRRRCCRGSCRRTARCPAAPCRSRQRRSLAAHRGDVDAVEGDPARRRARRTA